jgi:hypothetical protein
MKIKHIKRQVGPHGPGTVRTVGFNTGMTLMKYGLAEEVKDEKRGPGRPKKEPLK